VTLSATAGVNAVAGGKGEGYEARGARDDRAPSLATTMRVEPVPCAADLMHAGRVPHASRIN